MYVQNCTHAYNRLWNMHAIYNTYYTHIYTYVRKYVDIILYGGFVP